MRAAVGDRIVSRSAVVGGHVREGVVVELRHEGGEPPFVVEWSDSGERTLVFPGPDTRVEPGAHPASSPD